MKTMKQKLSLFLMAVLFILCLFAIPAYAESENYEAEDILAYNGLAARVADGTPGIRSLYTVNKNAVSYFEANGYTVAYGAVMAVGEMDGETLTDAGVPRTARTLTVTKNDKGFVTPLSGAAVVTVYETGAPDYATGLYVSESQDTATFAFTTIYGEERGENVDLLQGTQLCYAGFVALTKDGETTYVYDYAEGNEFGTGDSTYGVHTSVYEVSDYFLNSYRASNSDEKSTFAERATLRRTVSICGIVIGHDDMAKSGQSYEIEADEAAGTDATYVVKGTGVGNSVSFTVPNAKAGMYTLYLRATNNAGASKYVFMNANGRRYLGRIVENATAASSNYAVSSTDGYRDLYLNVMLDEGDNSFTIYMGSDGTATPIGIADAKFVMNAEISSKDIVLGGSENLDSSSTTVQKQETGTGILNGIPGTVFISNGSLTYDIVIPADGNYKMVSLSRFANYQKVTVTVKDAEGNTVAGTDFETGPSTYNESSRGLRFCDKYGTMSIPKGEYTLTIHFPNQMTMSNIALLYEEPVQEEPKEKTTVFDFVAKEQTLSSTTELSNGTVFMTRSSSLKMTVEIEQAGVYLLSGKHNTAGGKIHYLTMKSDIDTAHGMESRLFSSSSVTTYNDVEDFLVKDTSTDFVTADALGYIYLSEGTHTLTLKLMGSSGINGFGIYNLRLALATAQTEGSVRISGKKYNTATAVGVSDPYAQASGVRRITGKDGYAEYSFTPTKTGIYDMYGLIADRNGTKTSFTVKASDGTVVDTEEVNFGTAPYVTKWPQGMTMYAFGDAATAPIETAILSGVSLTAGETYTIAVDTLSAGSLLSIADLRMVFLETETDKDECYYYEVDAGFTSGAVDAATGDVVEKANSFVSEPLLVPKAGTTLRLVTTAAAINSALAAENLAVVAYTPAVGGYIPNLASDLTVAGNGYKGTDNGTIKVGAGYVVYTVTTVEDNTVLRFSAKAKEAVQVRLYAVSDEEIDITPIDLGEVDMSTHYVFDENAIGADISTLTTTVGITSPVEGCVLLLAYDKGEFLIGTAIGTKDEFVDSVAFDFTSGNYVGTVASLRALIVDNAENCTLLAETGLYDGVDTRYISASDFTVDSDYIGTVGGNENAVAIHTADMTASANVTTLSDGTLLLVNGSSVSFTVNAKKAGLYLLDMKMSRKNGFINKLIVKNNTYTAWNTGDYGYGFARIGTSGTKATATAEEDYAIGNTLRYGAFDGKADNYVYLLQGENKLTVSVDINVSGNKLGLDAIRLAPHTLAADASATVTARQMSNTPSGYTNTIASGSMMPNNGHWLKPNSTVYFTLEIPEDGMYDATMLGSAGLGAVFTIESADGKFLPVKADVSGENGASSTSTLPMKFGTLNLKKGTYTAKLLTVSGNYLHYNLILFNKVAEFDASKTLMVASKDMEFNKEDGSFTYTVRTLGVDPVTENHAMTERVVVTGRDANGEFSYTQENLRNAYETQSVFSGEARDGLTYIKVAYKLYLGDELVHEEVPFTYDAEAPLRVMVFADVHYTGLSEGQKIYSYALDGTRKEVVYSTLNSLNGYTRSYDIHGQMSDAKEQRVMDEIIRKYQSGEIDLVLFLGDQAMTDGNYPRFEINNIRYQKENALHFSDPFSETCNGYWRHPLNESYVFTQKFLTQLSAEGVPYFVANGNHDYVYTYSDDKTDLDFTEWERLYHYAELFGHRSDKNNGKYLREFLYDDNNNYIGDGDYIWYEDSDSVNYLVRVVRYQGEIKILSALSPEGLEAFKERYKGDGNCYDFYISEQILETNPEDVELLGAFMVGNPFQVDTYNRYTYVGSLPNDATGETVRSSYVKEDIVRSMMEQSRAFDNVYYVTHLPGKVSGLVKEYGIIDALLYGDVHTEEYYPRWADDVPGFVAGHVASPYDIESYMTTVDQNGNPITATKDEQYFSKYSTTLSNEIWGDMTRHPFNYMMLTLNGSVATLEREHLSTFYENGYNPLTSDDVTGWDVRYERAVADPSLYEAKTHYYVRANDKKLYTYEELGGNTEGYRKVYVGGDVGNYGSTYMYLTDNYVMNEWDLPEYVVGKDGSVYTTAWVKVGTAYVSEGGEIFTHSANFNAGTDEGTVLFVVFDDGVTESASFTMRGTIGDHNGHFIYDEKGDFVFVDTNGHYVFYTAQEKRDGYIEASIQEYYMLKDSQAYTLYDGPFERAWFYKNKAGDYVALDKDGDGILDDGIYTDIYTVTAEDLKEWGSKAVNKYNVDPAINSNIPDDFVPTIIVRNGQIVKGEGFCHFSYVANYSYADGTAVDESALAIDYDKNGNVVYGIYMPSMDYAALELDN